MMKIKKDSFICNLLFVLMIAYNLQGVLYENGAMLSKSFLLLYLAICMIYFSRVLLLKNNPTPIKILIAFIFLQTTYFIVDIGNTHFTKLGDVVNSSEQLKQIYYALLPCFPFYFLARKGAVTQKKIRIFFVCYLLTAILNYYHHLSSAIIERGVNSESFVNNFAYSFVFLLPFVIFFMKNKIASIIFIGICMSFIIMGAKRGAIISGFIALLIYFYYLFKQVDRRKFIQSVSVVIIFISIISVLIVKYINSNTYLQYRFEQLWNSNSSGRDEIYSTIFDYWQASPNVSNLLFGYGFNAAVDIAGFHAHNDWLELLSSSGLLGVGLYFLWFWSLYRFIVKTQLDLTNKGLLVMILAIWIVISMISMGYTSMSTAMFTILIGYVLGTNNRVIKNI